MTMASDDEYFAKEDACESDLFTENEENTHSMWIGGKLKLFFYIMTTWNRPDKSMLECACCSHDLGRT